MVLVTGASSGIGRDAALLLNGLGYTVAGTVRREVDADALVDAAPVRERMQPVLLDVTRDDQLGPARRDVEALLPEGRGLTALFSNAGIAHLTGELSAEACPIDVQRRVMEVNHWGAVRVIQTFLPLVRRERGTVVVNSALMAHTVLPFNAGYAASKCALEGWVDSLRREVGPHGVRVTLVEAGAVTTGLEGKQDLDAVPADSPYPEQRGMLRALEGLQASRGDAPARSPRRFSEAVVAAIQSPRPPVRTRVGGGAVPIWLLGTLPDRLQDLLITSAVRWASSSGSSAPPAAAPGGPPTAPPVAVAPRGATTA